MKKLLFGLFISALFLACNDKKEEPAATSTEPATAEKKKAATEVLDLSEADGVKAGLMAFAKGDIDGMTANFDDNVRFLFSGGDSLIGQQAVKDYYNGRWKLIDSFNYSAQVYLPIKLNESQEPQYATVGKWVLAWSFAHVKYKNAKTLNFWLHTDYHFNDAGKVDAVVQYLDRHPIMEATKDLMKK